MLFVTFIPITIHGFIQSEIEQENDTTVILEANNGSRWKAEQPEKLRLACVKCIYAFGAIKTAVDNGISDEDIIKGAVNICPIFEIINEQACTGFLQINLPTIAYIFRNEPAASAQTFCSCVLQDENNNNCPHNDARFEWHIDMPSLLDSNLPQKKSSKAEIEDLNIVFITDAHIDPRYEAGSPVDCDLPVCCRNENKDIDHYYKLLHNGKRYDIVNDTSEAIKTIEEKYDIVREIPKIKINARNGAGYWGDYGDCDTPIWAFDNILEEIRKNNPNIDYIYYTGDTVDHGFWETDRNLVLEMNHYVSNKLKSTFGEIPVFPVLGNHDTQAPNQYAPVYVTEDDINSQWLFDALPELWSWLPKKETEKTLKKGGYYSTIVKPGLRVIGLNSNVAYKMNWWVNFNPAAPKKQLQWLVETLSAAELAGEKVHILSHIPPGSGDLIQTWTREYHKIVERFTHIIAAEFNGHTHNDEFKIFYSQEGKPINVAFNGGSMTSFVEMNVNYKMFYIDGTSYNTLDVDTWIYNLTEANETPNDNPNWYLEYNFKNAYTLRGLSPTDLDDLIYRMVKTDKNLLQDYTVYFGKSGDQYLRKGCGENCKLSLLCRALTTELWKQQKCYEILGTNGMP